MDRHLILIGVGPGIGRSIACLFASKRYNKVTLIARRAEQLKIEEAAVQTAAVGNRVEVKSYAVDVVDTKALSAALVESQALFGQPECVYYNAARVGPSELLKYDVTDIENEFKVCPSMALLCFLFACFPPAMREEKESNADMIMLASLPFPPSTSRRSGLCRCLSSSPRLILRPSLPSSSQAVCFTSSPYRRFSHW